MRQIRLDEMDKTDEKKILEEKDEINKIKIDLKREMNLDEI